MNSCPLLSVGSVQELIHVAARPAEEQWDPLRVQKSKHDDHGFLEAVMKDRQKEVPLPTSRPDLQLRFSCLHPLHS